MLQHVTIHKQDTYIRARTNSNSAIGLRGRVEKINPTNPIPDPKPKQEKNFVLDTENAQELNYQRNIEQRGAKNP